MIIYKVTNQVNNMIYIGATTRPLHDRVKDHISQAERCNNNNETSSFYSEIATYGPDAFIWEQIDTASDINELASKECDYIYEYKSLDIGYNKDRGGGFSKKVFQYCSKTGNLLNSFNSLKAAADSIDASRKSISNACLGYTKSCKGHYWSYNLIENYKPNDERKKVVLQLTLKDQIINQFSSVAEASRESGLSKTCISRVCRGERESSGGFRWQYVHE